MSDYATFLDGKRQAERNYGFSPGWMPEFLYDFQADLVEWSVLKGRAAIFADCGLGKTPIQLVWAENVVRETGKPVLILTPLAVAEQTVREAEKFGIAAVRSRDGSIAPDARIVVTNYQRLAHFNPADFAGCVCDESSILKNFDGATKAAITEFMRLLPYRLLCTATPSPNDYIELGTASEALGELGFMDMLSRFFKREDKPLSRRNQFDSGTWRFRGHAERHFWRWVCSWARALRSPRDLGYDDARFRLPELRTHEHIVQAATRREGWLFDTPAVGLAEQREERRRTLKERCAMVAALVNPTTEPAVCWCHLNQEGDLLAKLIPDAAQIAGGDSDERKEDLFEAFTTGRLRVLVTKPTIAGFGLNWQHCAHQTFFPSHSFEQWYQAIRRSWRFGQARPVLIDVVASEGERGVLANLQRKAEAADRIFEHLVALMNEELRITQSSIFTETEELPAWLCSTRS